VTHRSPAAALTLRSPSSAASATSKLKWNFANRVGQRRRGSRLFPHPAKVEWVTHSFSLDQIEEAYDLFGHQRDGVLKVADRKV
jgi:hypothetical protein